MARSSFAVFAASGCVPRLSDRVAAPVRVARGGGEVLVVRHVALHDVALQDVALQNVALQNLALQNVALCCGRLRRRTSREGDGAGPRRERLNQARGRWRPERAHDAVCRSSRAADHDGTGVRSGSGRRPFGRPAVVTPRRVREILYLCALFGEGPGSYRLGSG